MRFALNVASDNRILSACKVLERGNYEGMPVVDALPDGDISDYRYENGEYTYDPLPHPEEPTPELTQEERIKALEDAMSAIEEGIASV